MALWTDLQEPLETTGVARVEYDDREAAKGTLAQWLPNLTVDSDHVKWYTNAAKLTDVAQYRAFNAPPEIGAGPGTKATVIDLPAISREEPIDEITQKEIYNLVAAGGTSLDRAKRSVEAATRRNAAALSARNELTRGMAIATGAVAVDQDNFWINDAFGRDAALTFTAGTLWSTLSADRIGMIQDWIQLYSAKNGGQEPGAMVMGRAEFATFSKGTQFATLLANGATRPGLAAEVRAIADAAGIPPIFIYDRSVSVGGVTTRVLPAGKVFFLPEPGATVAEAVDETALGVTYVGRTVSASFPSWGIPDAEQPGIVAGVIHQESVGSSVRVQADMVSEPVLTNPNLSMVVTVV